MRSIKSISGVVTLAFAALAYADDVSFHPHYAEALAEAKSSGRPLLIEFRCVP